MRTGATIGVMFATATWALVGCGSEQGLEAAQSERALMNGAQGFAWVNIASGTPHASYSHNTSGGAISVSTSGTGMYTVRFAGLGGSGGNAQAVAYGTSANRCKVSSWASSGSDLDINIRCHTPAGALVSSAFVVQFGRRTTNNGTGGYLYAHQPTTPSYDVLATYSWNSSGGVNRIVRNGAGNYDAFFPGLAAFGGSVQITAHGSGSEHCKVSSYGPSSGDQRVGVRCFATDGTAVDTRFMVNLFGDEMVGIRDLGAYVYANNPTSASYTPLATWSYNSGFINGWEGCPGWIGDNFASRSATGVYAMHHTLLDPQDSAVHVTALGTDSAYCKVEGWNGHSSGDGTSVRVRCFAADGTPADSRYVETYSSSWFRGPC